MCCVPSMVWHLKQPCSVASRRPCSTRLPSGGAKSSAVGAPSCRWARPRCSAETQSSYSPHDRVARAAVFRAEDLVAARLRRLEPRLRVAARQHVLLDAELRDVEGVDDVARGHEEPHRPPRRHVQHVHRVGPARVGELPHPLLAHHVHVHRVLRRRGLLHVRAVAHHPPEQEEGERDDYERGLHHQPGLDVRRRLRLAPAPVEDEEEDGGQSHRGGHHEGGEDDEVVELVDLQGEGRSLVGQEEQAAQELVHAPVLLRFHSCRQRTVSPTARARKEASAPPRTKFIA